MIHKIRMANWRSHETTSMEMDPGTSAILGIMGSGKSSILQAIVFGLYGDLPVLREKKAKLDDMIMSKPSRKQEAEIEVGFAAKGDRWSVKRKIARETGTTHAELRKNDMLIESGTERVTEYVTNLLGVDFDLFTKAVYAKQNEIDYFLTLPKGKRMEKIDELLNLDKLEASRQLLSSAITKVKGAVDALESMLKQKDPESLVKQVEQADASLKEMDAGLARDKDELSKTKEVFSNVQARLVQLEAEKTLHQQRDKQYYSLQQMLKDVETRLGQLQEFSALESPQARLDELSSKRTEAIRIKQESAKLSGERESLLSRKASLDAQLSVVSHEDISQLKQERAGMQDAFAKALADVESLEGQVQESPAQKLQGELNAVLREHQDVNKALAAQAGKEDEANDLFDQLDGSILSVESGFRNLGKLEGMGKPVETCDQALRMANASDSELRVCIRKVSESGTARSKAVDLYKREQELRKKCEDLKQQHEQCNRELLERSQALKLKKQERDGLQASLATLSERMLRVENAATLASERDSAIERLASIDARLSSLSVPDLEGLDAQIEGCRKALELQQLAKRKTEVEAGIREVQEAIASCTFDPENYRLMQSQKEELIGRLGSLASQVEGAQRLLLERAKYRDALAKEVETIKLEGDKLSKEKRVFERATMLNNALKDAQEMLRKEFVNTVNQAMCSVWSMIYPYQDYPGIRLDIADDGMKRGDYNLELEDRTGRWVPVDLASGGERSMACLALRIAFVKVLVPSFRLLILDEPTHNLDSRGVEELSNALRDRVSDILEQVLVITHEDKLEKAVTGSCFRVVRDKGNDQPSQVVCA